MHITITKAEDSEIWTACLNDNIGVVGPSVSSYKMADAVFLLGVIYGRDQKAFSRPLEEILRKEK